MNAGEFIDRFRELIQTDDDVTLDTPLSALEEWDSMAVMAMIAWFDVEHGIKTDFAQLNALSTVGDLARLLPDFSA